MYGSGGTPVVSTCKDAKARAGDDVLVKLAIDAPLDLVRKVLKYV